MSCSRSPPSFVACGLAGQVDRHLGRHRLVPPDPDEVEVDVGLADRVADHLPGQHELLAPAEVEVDERVGPAGAVQDVLQLPARHRHRLGLAALAVDDGRDLPVPPDLPGRRLPGRPPDVGDERDLFHLDLPPGAANQPRLLHAARRCPLSRFTSSAMPAGCSRMSGVAVGLEAEAEVRIGGVDAGPSHPRAAARTDCRTGSGSPYLPGRTGSTGTGASTRRGMASPVNPSAAATGGWSPGRVAVGPAAGAERRPSGHRSRSVRRSASDFAKPVHQSGFSKNARPPGHSWAAGAAKMIHKGTVGIRRIRHKCPEPRTCRPSGAAQGGD